MKISAIYMIQNIKNHKKYVGSSRHAYSRRNGHFSALQIGNHPNHKLQKDFNKYGIDAFQFSILEQVPDVNKLQEIEQYWLDTLQPEYNVRKIAENVSWEFQSEEARSRIAESTRKRQTGRIQSQEEKEKRADSVRKFWATHPPKTIPQDMRKHLSKINMGKKNPNWGLKRTPEQLKNMSEGRSNIIYIFKSPDGELVSVRNLSKCNLLPYGALRNLYRGLTKQHKGWTFIESKKAS